MKFSFFSTVLKKKIVHRERFLRELPRFFLRINKTGTYYPIPVLHAEQNVLGEEKTVHDITNSITQY